MKNTTHLDLVPRITLIITPLLVSAVYFFFNFLDVEDSYLYFSRVNYLDGPIFVYYNGHIQFLSQLLAYLSSPMTPLMQAANYAIFSLASVMLMIFLLFKLIRNKYLLIIYISYIAIFFSLVFYNLANSIWIGLLISGLIPYYLIKKKKEAGLLLPAFAFIFALSFPVTILAIPLYLALFAEGRSRIFSLIMILWLLVLPLYFLTNWESGRTDMLVNLSNNLGNLFSEPYNFFYPDLVLKSDLPSRLAEFISFFGMFIIVFIKFYRKNLDLADFTLFLLAFGVVFLAFVSKTHDNFFMGPRYFLPSMMVFLIFLDSLLRNNLLFVRLISIVSLILVIASINERYFPIDQKKFQDFSFLVQGFIANEKIDRGGGWIVPLRATNYNLSSCKVLDKESNHELFIFCDDRLGEIPLKYTLESNK